jgi:hypothetical protein
VACLETDPATMGGVAMTRIGVLGIGMTGGVAFSEFERYENWHLVSIGQNAKR